MTDSVCSQKSPVPTLCAGLFINHETSEVYLHLNVWPFRLPLLWPRLISGTLALVKECSINISPYSELFPELYASLYQELSPFFEALILNNGL